MEKRCVQCGGEILGLGAQFCSRDCQHEGALRKIEKSCKTCGNPFTVRPCEAKRFSTCSASCRRVARAKERNPNWRGGFTKSPRKNASYNRWRKAVLKRDGHKCVACESTEKLEAHHIKPWAWFPALRYAVKNGQTLCRKCHEKHSRSIFDLRPAEFQYSFNFSRLHKTNCPHGHPLDGFTSDGKTSHRYCKTCNRLKAQRRRTLLSAGQ